MPSRRRRRSRRRHSHRLTRRTIRVGQNGGGILLPALPATGERSAGVRRLCVADLPPLRRAARAGRRAWHRLTALLLLLFAAGCGSRPAPKPSTGVAYSGPTTLNLRRDLASKSPVVGDVP